MKEVRIADITAESRATDPAGAESLVLSGQPIVYDIQQLERNWKT